MLRAPLNSPLETSCSQHTGGESHARFLLIKKKESVEIVQNQIFCKLEEAAVRSSREVVSAIGWTSQKIHAIATNQDSSLLWYMQSIVWKADSAKLVGVLGLNEPYSCTGFRRRVNYSRHVYENLNWVLERYRQRGKRCTDLCKVTPY